jgi:hypothetical protein
MMDQSEGENQPSGGHRKVIFRGPGMSASLSDNISSGTACEVTTVKFKKLIKQLMASASPASVADPDGMSATIGGSAQAFGDNTLASGQVVNKMVDKGPYTIAQGTAEFVAAAQSKPGGIVAAGATTQAVIDGADFVITMTMLQAVVGTNSVTVKSVTKFIAIDIDGWAPAGGPVMIELGMLQQLPSMQQKHHGHHKQLKLLGNLGTVEAAATAYGDNTVAATATDSLAIENQYSAVSAVALTGIA